MKNKVRNVQTTHVDKQLRNHSVQVPLCALHPNCNFESKQKGNRRVVILLLGAFKWRSINEIIKIQVTYGKPMIKLFKRYILQYQKGRVGS